MPRVHNANLQPHSLRACTLFWLKVAHVQPPAHLLCHLHYGLLHRFPALNDCGVASILLRFLFLSKSFLPNDQEGFYDVKARQRRGAKWKSGEG